VTDWRAKIEAALAFERTPKRQAEIARARVLRDRLDAEDAERERQLAPPVPRVPSRLAVACRRLGIRHPNQWAWEGGSEVRTEVRPGYFAWRTGGLSLSLRWDVLGRYRPPLGVSLTKRRASEQSPWRYVLHGSRLPVELEHKTLADALAWLADRRDATLEAS
jgi:hypothetical protein